MRTIYWDFEKSELCAIDQRLLPAELKIVSFDKSAAVATAIQNMTVRGAPAIGVAAAFGLALEARRSRAHDKAALLVDLDLAAIQLKAARPTAVNLTWALDRILLVVRQDSELLNLDELRAKVLAQAQRLADQDVEINRRMA